MPRDQWHLQNINDPPPYLTVGIVLLLVYFYLSCCQTCWCVWHIFLSHLMALSASHNSNEVWQTPDALFIVLSKGCLCGMWYSMFNGLCIICTHYQCYLWQSITTCLFYIDRSLAFCYFSCFVWFGFMVCFLSSLVSVLSLPVKPSALAFPCYVTVFMFTLTSHSPSRPHVFDCFRV